jgi:hypothetical protein
MNVMGKTRKGPGRICRTAIAGFAGVVFIRTCLTANVPDQLAIVYPSQAAVSYRNAPEWTYHLLKHTIIPGQAMQAVFSYDYYGKYINANYLKIKSGLFLTKPYKELYIKELGYELNGRHYNLIDNKRFTVPEINPSDMLVDENDEPITINGENYYWASMDLNKKTKHHFINGTRGQEKTIQIIQIYSFDDEPLREEKYTYKVICGGIQFDPLRMIAWLYPP